jgi:hypothetical protein
MLEDLLSFWKAKIFVLCLLGFVATAWLVTMNLSTADATAHLVKNPFVADFLQGREVIITLLLLVVLGAVFLKGFKEAIGVAVVVVGAYLLLNLVVVAVGLYESVANPRYVTDWSEVLFTSYGNPLTMTGVLLLIFPAPGVGALGLRDRREPDATGRRRQGGHPTASRRPRPQHAQDADYGRNNHELLPARDELRYCGAHTARGVPARRGGQGSSASLPGTRAPGQRLRHGLRREHDNHFVVRGGVCAGGALEHSAALPPPIRHGPEWAWAVRPLVLVYIASAMAITIIFKASVDAQAGAYATGVLAMMASAAIAVTISARHAGSRLGAVAFGLITLIFLYGLVANVIDRPDGIMIALYFVGAIILASLVSRVWRTTELRTEKIEVDETAQRFIDAAASAGEEIHVIANMRQMGGVRDYHAKEKEQREHTYIPPDVPILFLEVDVDDPSEFEDVLEIRAVHVSGYRVLRAKSSTVPNGIATFLLHLHDTNGKVVHCYFNWTQGSPLVHIFRYVLLGEGDIAPVAHEVLRRAEPDLQRRPVIHVVGK